MDYSGLEAIENLAQRYHEQGKRLHLKFLRPACLHMVSMGEADRQCNRSLCSSCLFLACCGPPVQQISLLFMPLLGLLVTGTSRHPLHASTGLLAPNDVISAPSC